MAPTFAPLEESNRYLNDTRKLTEIMSKIGYLFFRNLIPRKTVQVVAQEMIAVLKRYGFVDPTAISVPIWSDKMPEGAELAATGRLMKAINRVGSYRQLILKGEHLRLLEKIMGGEIFSWTENVDRGIRAYLPGEAEYGLGGVKIANVTPAHQDYYHFRVPNYRTAWIPLIDIDESTGGLAIVAGSHRDGYYEHWFRGSEYLGVPEDSEEAKKWASKGAVPATGELKTGSDPKTWLRANYRMGDVLMFHPLILHRGLRNRSDKIRLSADVRYQLKGTPTFWRARHTHLYSKGFEAELRKYVGRLGLEEQVAQRVSDIIYVEGPRRREDLEARINAKLSAIAA